MRIYRVYDDYGNPINQQLFASQTKALEARHLLVVELQRKLNKARIDRDGWVKRLSIVQGLLSDAEADLTNARSSAHNALSYTIEWETR